MVLQTPLNISTTNSSEYNTCKELCAYAFDYKTSSTIATVNEGYLSLNYLQSQDAQITFNNIPMQVHEVRLYSQTITRFDDASMNGLELYIHHIDTQNQGINFMVCVPIMVSDIAPQSNAQNFIQSILPHLVSTNPDPVAINQAYSLNDFVPYATFMTAETTLPYPPYNGEYRTVYFLPNEHVPILSTTVAQSLRQLLGNPTLEDAEDYYTPSPSEMMINPTGSTNPDEANAGDDIWIDCQPTGDSVIPQTELEKEIGLPQSVPFTDRIRKLWNNKKYGDYMKIIVFVLAVMVLVMIGIKTYKPVIAWINQQTQKVSRPSRPSIPVELFKKN